MGTALHSRPPPFELFFAPLEVTLKPSKLECVRFAYIASKYGHAGQVRDDGTRYFDHPKASAWIYIHELDCRNVRMICVLLLHDISEDTYLLSPYRMSLNFGIDIALDVHALTKLPGKKESAEEFLQRIIERGPEAILGKLIDRLHNLRTLSGCTEEKRKAQRAETCRFHLPMLVPALKSHGGEWAQLAVKVESLINQALDQR
jgi:GTP pyrophosphokinase